MTLLPYWRDGRVGPFEVRWHGRGGQGTVTAAEVLAVAAFDDGLFAQAFPSFGSERMGAPVEAYCRLALTAIRTHEPVLSPDALVVADPTLVHAVDLFAGLRDGALVLVNSSGPPGALGIGDLASALPGARVETVPGTDLGRRHLGRPTPNAALLGAFAAASGTVSLDAVASAFRERFPGPVGEANAAAAAAGHAAVARGRERARAGAD